MLKHIVDIDGISIYLAVFSLSWMALGLFNVIISQSFVNEWYNMEFCVSKRELIFRSIFYNTYNNNNFNRNYENLHLKNQSLELT
jgi:hypothetical protein